MALPKLKDDDRFTYVDYLTWDDDQRWELIDGEVFCMSPGPSRRHQELLLSLARPFADYLDDKKCSILVAPFDVCLSSISNELNEEIDTVVQPDILIVCDPEKLTDRACKGAPDLIIEIISPSTSKHDITTKYDLYQRYGVKEYWLLYPNDRTLLVYRLGNDGTYVQPDVFGEGDLVPVPLLGELVINMGKVFG
ncbi:MAG TPA: Uma2 family endonuclease [Desulfuromonadales bacterium]|nr:Uma2 family endonuclease [Desulfuromonadales bacterium]